MAVRYARGLHFLPAMRARSRERLDEERVAALAWSRERAAAPGELAERLPFTLTDVRARFPDVFREAHARVDACPLDEFGGVVNGGAANVDLLYSLARALGARTVVETGVAFGWSTLALLLAIGDREGAHVFSTDLPHCFNAPQRRWRDGDEWVGAAAPHTLRERWTLYPMADREGLPRALRAAGPVDLAHYDSDKSLENCAFGYTTLWDSLREGGALVAAEVDRNLAFRRFAEEVGGSPVIVEGDGNCSGILFKQPKRR